MTHPESGLPAGTPRPEDDLDDDDVVGHRFLTPDQAQERAERARADRERGRDDEPGAPADGDLRNP